MTTKVAAKMTPGPWLVIQGTDATDFIVGEPSGNTIAETNAAVFIDPHEFDKNVRHISLAEARANARAIAKLPELVEALREIAASAASEHARSAANADWHNNNVSNVGRGVPYQSATPLPGWFEKAVALLAEIDGKDGL